MVTARLTRIEVHRYLHHSTRRQDSLLEANLQVRAVLELGLDTEEGGVEHRRLSNKRLTSWIEQDISLHMENNKYTQVPDVPFAFVADYQSLGGWYHARTVQKALAEVVLGEGEFQARCYSPAFDGKGKCCPEFYLTGGNTGVSSITGTSQDPFVVKGLFTPN